MHPIVSDPNNHAPEVSPEDVWGDAGEFSENPAGGGTILPPRRTPAPVFPVDDHECLREGLRIDSNPERLLADDPDCRLDVQEIDGTVVRLNPEEPTQPRMPRHMAIQKKEPAKPREFEGRDWGLAGKLSVRWVAGVALGVVALIVVTLSLLPSINRSNAATSRSDQAVLSVVPQEGIDGGKVTEDLMVRVEEAERLFKTFASATVTNDVLSVVRNVDAVAPLVRERGCKPVATKQWSPGNDVRWNVCSNGGKPYAVLEGDLPDFSRFRAYFVMQDGELQLAWKATTAYGSATFAELAENRGDPSEIRGTIMPAGYYSPVFPEADYQSYQLISPDNESAVWCYTRRGSDVGEAIKTLFRGGDILKPALEPHKITLRLEHGTEGAFPNQWLIGEMLNDEWISP